MPVATDFDRYVYPGLGAKLRLGAAWNTHLVLQKLQQVCASPASPLYLA
jgi:hypothetical protein